MKVNCSYCHGTGADPETGETCHVCAGTGLVAPKGVHGETHAYVVDSNARLMDLEVKMDALDTHLDVLDTHLDAIETKIDALE